MELSTAQVCGGGHAGAAKVLTGTGTLSSYEARDSSGSGHWARHEEVWLPPLDMGRVPPGDRVPGEMRPAARSRPRLPAAHRPSAPLVPRPAARPRLVIGHTSRQAAPALAKELQVARPRLVNVRAAPAPAPGRSARLAGAGTVSSQAGPGRCGRGLGWRQR